MRCTMWVGSIVATCETRAVSIVATMEIKADRKARGAFFTPGEVTEFLARWAIRMPSDVILEPSCGEAAFLLPIACRLKELGTSPTAFASQVYGQDIHRESIEVARNRLGEIGAIANLHVGDFFSRQAEPVYDAVIGNPPYIRYQEFTGAARAKSLEAALVQGVRLNQLASSWAAFTVHASAFLKPEGRLALVLPAELLSVKYAAQIRRFLLDRFRRVRLVLFEGLVFPGVLEDVVLLLAEGQGRAEHFEVYQARNAQDLASRAPEHWIGFVPSGDEKWTSALLPSEAISLYGQISSGPFFETMSCWGRTYLGAVTGNNEYFTLTKDDAARLELPQSELIRISPPGSRHLRGLSFSEHAWEKLADSGARCYLFSPTTSHSEAAARYIAKGKRKGVAKAYKCKVRDPWWSVPRVPRPDLIFAYMNHDRPRLIRNGAGVHLLNSLYGVKLSDDRRETGEELLPIASLNSLTLLGAEIVGRAYGGGMLKHEPTEVGVLPVPSLEVLREVGERLALVQNQVAGLMRQNDIAPAVDIVDRVILSDHMGLAPEQVQALKHARDILMKRRMTRARGPNGAN